MRSKCCLDLEVGDSVTKLNVANKSPFDKGDKKSSSVKVSAAADLNMNMQKDRHNDKNLENVFIVKIGREPPVKRVKIRKVRNSIQKSKLFCLYFISRGRHKKFKAI